MVVAGRITRAALARPTVVCGMVCILFFLVWFFGAKAPCSGVVLPLRIIRAEATVGAFATGEFFVVGADDVEN